MKQYLAIDIGGTAVKLGIVDETGRVLLKGEESVSFDGYQTPVLTTVRRAAKEFLTANSIPVKVLRASAFSATGQIDSRKGIVAGTCGNFPQLHRQPYQVCAGRGLRPAVTVANDANCMTLGEVWVGGAKGYTDVIGVTLGTGVGGGIIANGQLVRGVHFTAGEYSFVNTNAEAWDAPDQNMACQCSTKYLLKWYRARKGLPADAPMNGKLFFEAANAAEPEALEVLERFCRMVAVQIYNLNVLLDLEKVAIGGGISKQPILVETLNEVYEEYILRGHPFSEAQARCLPRPEIVPCRFLSEANQIGAFASYQKAFLEK